MKTCFLALAWLALGALLAGCGATAQQIIPTQRPTVTATFTPAPTRTPGFATSPTHSPLTATFGPSPTSIFGPTSTAVAVLITPTRLANPNAPRIEYFTANVLALAPGEPVTLFWAVRGARGAVIYRLDRDGNRSNLWNVPPDGSLTVPTRRSERGSVNFVLSVGEGDLSAEQTLTIPLTCPDAWFFQPAPEDCPAGPAQPTIIIEQPFERGRMIYVQAFDQVYALFNDGREPAWVAFANRYDPSIHPELDEAFERAVPPGLAQPLRILGFVWRGNDLVRNRLGLGVAGELAYEGFVQTLTTPEGDNLYVNSADGSVLQLVPGGALWQIIALP